MIISATQRLRRGHAMVAMLIVLAFLTAVLGAMSTGLLSEMKYVTLQQDYMVVQYAARAGFETACRELLKDQQDVDALTDDWNGNQGAFENIRVGEAVCQVSYFDETVDAVRYGVTDEERKINVNLAKPEVLKKLSTDFSNEVVEAIVKTRAERPFVTLDQVAALPVMPQGFLDNTSKELPAGLRSVLTVHGDGRVNVNTAPKVVLAALVGEDAAKKIVEIRSTGTLKTLSDAADIPLDSNAHTVSSRFFSIRSEGSLPNSKVASTLRWFVQRDDSHITVLGMEKVQ